jgi:hypothetical protein
MTAAAWDSSLFIGSGTTVSANEKGAVWAPIFICGDGGI